MENNEILNELAQAMGNIIENKVAERTKELEENNSVVETFLKEINEGKVDWQDIEQVLCAIRDNYESAMEDAAKSFVDDNCSEYIKADDIDQDWIEDNVGSDIIRDVAKKYVEENL